MRKITDLCVLLTLLLNAIHGDQNISHHSNHQNTTQNCKTDSEKDIMCQQLLPASYEFAVHLYKQIALESDKASENIFFSPFSISTAFTMLSLGTRSSTRDQIHGALSLNLTTLTEDDIHRCFEKLLHMINSDTDELQVNTGTALFLQKGISFLPKFLEDVKHYYQTDALNIDFENPYKAKKYINDYVSKKTHGKIVDLVQKTSEDNVMLLLNYICFKGKWAKPFDSIATVEDDFFLDENTTIKLPMMFRSGDINMFYDGKLPVLVIELPYNENASMMLVLPGKGKMKKVEDALSKDTVNKWKQKLSHRFAMLQMPKFSLSTSYELDNLLKGLGITDLFSKEADLSGIADDQKLQVSKVLHTAALEVDEEGTEAKASTTIEVEQLSLPEIINFNRPFLVLIYTYDTQTILFIGKLVNPAQH